MTNPRCGIAKLLLGLFLLTPAISGCGYRRTTVDAFESLVSIENESKHVHKHVAFFGEGNGQYLFIVIYGMFDEDRISVPKSDIEIVPNIKVGHGSTKAFASVKSAFGMPGLISRIEAGDVARLRGENQQVLSASPKSLNGEVVYWLVTPIENG